VLFVLAFCCCCYCYCSRKRKRNIVKNQKTWEEMKREDEMLGLTRSKTPVTDSRRQYLNSKYPSLSDRSRESINADSDRGRPQKRSLF